MKIRDLDTTNGPLTEAHLALGLPPVEQLIAHPSDHPVLRIALWLMIFVLVSLVGYLGWRLFFGDHAGLTAADIIRGAAENPAFWTAVAVGFLAQAIDGALGMAYGITATTFLLSTGATPAAASASVHIAEVFTTGSSGFAHAKLGNIDRTLFVKLLLPGMVGAVLGAYVITQFDGAVLKPFIAVYLLLMGLYILSKAVRGKLRTKKAEHVAKLALLGGFVDSAGGGGWGPVVTTTLLGSGNDPRTTIGSVNFAEFFLTVTTATSFILLAGNPGTWLLVSGLVLGGLFAAPFAALLCRLLPARALLVVVGVLISGISVWNLYEALV